MSVLEFVKRVGRTAIGGSLKRVVGRHCVHQWKKRPDLNVLYACGEDGAYGWKCSACGLVAHTDEDMPPNKQISDS